MSDSHSKLPVLQAAGLGGGAGSQLVKSPTKSPPVRAPAAAATGAPGHPGHRPSTDDVAYRQQDSTHAADQAAAGEGAHAPSAAPHAPPDQGLRPARGSDRYMQLLCVVYSGPQQQAAGSRRASSSGGVQHTATTGTPSPPVLRAGSPARRISPPALTPPRDAAAGAAGAATPPLRASASPSGVAPRTAAGGTPGAGRRSRSSILDSSGGGGSLIPTSPCLAPASSIGRLQQAQPLLLQTRDKAAGTPPGSRVQQRRAAFGSHIEPPAAALAAGQRRPSPLRGLPRAPGTTSSTGGVLGSAAARAAHARTAASPQRMPSGARAAAAAAPASAASHYRSTSAPRMASVDKAQSRFTQHTLSAAAAQRSRTPNPAPRAAAVHAPAAGDAGAAVGSSPAARRVRAPPGGSSAENRHIARMQRASEAAAAGVVRVPGPHSSLMVRSPAKPAGLGGLYGPPSPQMRAASAGSRIVPTAPADLSSKPGPRSERVSMAAAAAAAGSGADDGSSGTGYVLPAIKDRYRSLYKAATPAVLAVEEARAAAAAAAVASEAAAAAGLARARVRAAAAVPKLSLAGLSLGAPAGGERPLAAPRGPQQQEPAHEQQLTRPVSHSPPQQQGQQQARTGSPSTPVARGTSAHGSAAASSTPAAVFSDIDLTPPRSEGPDDTPSLLMKQQGRSAGSCSAGGSGGGKAGSPAGHNRHSPPPLAPRNLLADGMSAPASPSLACGVGGGADAKAAAGRLPVPVLALPAAASSGSSKSAAAAVPGLAATAKGPVPPLLSKLPGAAPAAAAAAAGSAGRPPPSLLVPAAAPACAEEGDVCESPPRHRRGGPGSPEARLAPGAAAAPAGRADGQQQGIKAKASSVCSHTASSASKAAVTAAAVRGSPSAASKAKQQDPPARRSLGALAAAGAPCAAAAGTAGGVSILLATPPRRRLQAPPPIGVDTKGASCLPSPSKRPSTPVPRLDLTPVLSNLEAEEQEAAAAAQQQGLLRLEDALRPLSMQDLEKAASDECDDRDSDGLPCSGAGQGSKRSAGKGKAPAAAAPGSKGKQASGGGKKAGGGSATDEAAQQESFYVYESVMPAEEVRSYLELRRVLLRTPGGSRHVASLQGLWGCYQDARRNTEAMAFRGHRLLDQVSTEYGCFKKEAEVQLEALAQERDEARQEAQLAMVAGSVPASALQLAAKDQEVAELQAEVSALRQQVVEMEKALRMAADFHCASQAAHQASQVPTHARVIAASTTTSILTNMTMEQQARLQASEKQLEDMRAALHLVCGVLRQTDFANKQGGLRSKLDSDTLQVLDTIMATEEMEAVVAEAVVAQQMTEAQGLPLLGEASPAVQIEEVVDDGGDPGISEVDVA